MASVASKTATKFHPAPQKGLLRICEKLALAPEWRPELVFGVTRGAIECPSFSMVISVLRLLQDMDSKPGDYRGNWRHRGENLRNSQQKQVWTANKWGLGGHHDQLLLQG